MSSFNVGYSVIEYRHINSGFIGKIFLHLSKYSLREFIP